MSAVAPLVVGVVSGWVACSYDDITLLVPIEDTGTQMGIDELESSMVSGLELGMLRWQDGLWPAYCLDRELAPRTYKPTSSARVLPVCANGQARGIVCDYIRILDHPVAVTLHAIPGCLNYRPTPVIAFGLYDTLRVGLVVRGESIIRHLDAILEIDAR